MFLTTFVSSLNKGNLITPILLKRKLIVEFRSIDKGSYFLELSSSESKLLSIQPLQVDFVIEGEYDIDTIDEYDYRYTTSASTVPNILFKIGNKMFAFNKSNYIAKMALKYMQEKNKTILDNLAIINKRMGLTQ